MIPSHQSAKIKATSPRARDATRPLAKYHALTNLNEDALDVLCALCRRLHVNEAIILGVLMRLLELHLPERAGGKTVGRTK